MGLSDGHYVLLQQMAAAQDSADGWVTETFEFRERSAAPLVKLGLTREATQEDRAEISAKAARPILWAVQLTDHGWDVLRYAQLRHAPATAETVVEPGLRRVALRPSETEVLRRYLTLSGQLRHAPAPGLDTAAQVARFDADTNRWFIDVSDEQL